MFLALNSLLNYMTRHVTPPTHQVRQPSVDLFHAFVKETHDISYSKQQPS